MRVGIDIGNVIIGGGGDDTQFFGDDYLNTPEVPGAYTSVERVVYGEFPTIINQSETSLGEHVIQNEIHFISKCGKAVENKTMEWLYTYRWGYLIDNQAVHFVRKRELKAPMAQALQLDIFIDDRQDVLDHMEAIVAHRILFTSWEQTNQELEKIFNETG